MWLISWRSRLFSLCLMLIIASSTLSLIQSDSPMSKSPSMTELLLLGYSYAQEMESDTPVTFSSHKSQLNARELCLIEILQWIAIAWWAFLTTILSVKLIPHSGPSWQWLLLLFSSHKLVADLNHERVAWQHLVAKQAHSVLENQQMVALARMVNQTELETSSRQAVECESCKKNSVASNVKLTTSEEDQPAPPIIAQISQKNSQQSNPKEPATSQDQAVQQTKEIEPQEQMLNELAQLVVDLPVGTNLGMFHFLWMMVTGQLLASRGAIFPALQAAGLSKEAVRRSWSAFATTSWRVETLLAKWEDRVISQQKWQERSYQGYHPKAVDITAFWRPALSGCTTKHYSSVAGRALPAIVLGMAARIGDIDGKRVPLPCLFVRSDEDDPAESALQKKLIQQVRSGLQEDEIAILDAGFPLSQLIELGLTRCVVRLAKNFVGRRNYLPEYKGKGRHPEYGEKVRPLARQSRTRLIEATPPDQVESWQEGEFTIKAEMWKNLVLSNEKPGAQTFNVFAIHDPRFKKPLLLATPVGKLTAQTVRKLYQDRWPVEQLPLAAKQMLGAGRQFVWNEENRQRLPELSLLAGSILTHVAASVPPIPTGFWDRAPKATPGRLRRFLNHLSLDRLLSNFPLPARLRKKASLTSHLKKGILARRATNPT